MNASKPRNLRPATRNLQLRALMSTVMYVKPRCPYCQAAREHLAAESEPVEERDATQSSQWKAELMGYTNNRGIVPTIVRDDGTVQVGFPPGRG